MAVALEDIEWNDALLPAGLDVDQSAFVKQKLGGVPSLFTYLGSVPWLLRTMAAGFQSKGVAFIPLGIAEVAALVTAQENACRHCYGAQRAMMRLQGFSEERILDLEREVQLADGQTRAVVEFARRLSRSNPRPALMERDALIASGLSREAVAELAFVICLNCFNNRLATFMAVPPEPMEALSQKWWFRLFARVTMGGKFKAQRVGPAALVKAEGPLAPVIESLGGIPGAQWLNQFIWDCMASPIIPARAKLLMFGTVARALSCPLCQSGVREMLAAQGLGEAALDEMLSSLDSPQLTPLERKLLPWARETVRYESHVIQARTRELHADLGDAVTLEAIATAALGNMVVRLAMLTQ